MMHVNELTFEGETPWIKAMNESNYYWTKYCDESLSKEEQHKNFTLWQDIRMDIEMGLYGNNS